MEDCEIVLPRRVPRQPEPRINAGGDCGACVLSALTGLSVSDIYTELREDKKVYPFSWQEMISTLYECMVRHYLVHIITECPNWITTVYRAPFGFTATQMNLEWFNYVRLAIEAGYYPVCEVKMDGKLDYKGLAQETDHWVLLCGIRVRREPNTQVAGAFNILTEVLISDSSKTQLPERWIDSMEFLRIHGGFTPLLAKPVRIK